MPEAFLILLFLLRRRQKKIARTMRIMSTTPPAAPPAIAATLVDFELELVFDDLVPVGCGKSDESGTCSLAIVRASLASHRSCAVTFSYAQEGIVIADGMASGKNPIDISSDEQFVIQVDHLLIPAPWQAPHAIAIEYVTVLHVHGFPKPSWGPK